jgi:hypothetical protein
MRTILLGLLALPVSLSPRLLFCPLPHKLLLKPPQAK